MNKPERYVVGALLLIVALWVPAVSKAQSAFDGTWKTNLAQAKLSPKPNISYLSQGWYHCVSCATPFDVQADGQDHAVSGQTFDTISVTVVDPNTISIVAKKGGKTVYEQTRSVSPDGKMLTVKSTSHPMNSDQPITTEVTAKRVGIAPAGVHATSGSWQIDKIKQSDNALLVTYKTKGDEMTMSEPDGATYTAKFDGNDYPFKGSYYIDTVSLKKIDAHTFEETDKRAGQVVEVDKVSVSGRTMTVVANNKLTGRTSTFIATKQ